MLAEGTEEMVLKYRKDKINRNEGYQEFKTKILNHMKTKLEYFYP
jgi:hypothetical protein